MRIKYLLTVLVSGVCLWGVGTVLAQPDSQAGPDRQQGEQGPPPLGPPPHGPHDGPPAPEKIFEEMDADGDGQVSLDEFKAHHEEHRAGRRRPGGPQQGRRPGPPPRRGGEMQGPPQQGAGYHRPPGPPPRRSDRGEVGHRPPHAGPPHGRPHQGRPPQGRPSGDRPGEGAACPHCQGQCDKPSDKKESPAGSSDEAPPKDATL